MTILLQDISELKPGGLYIYGAGGIAQSMAAAVRQKRPDIEFKGFLTSFASTQIAQNISEALPGLRDSDTIVVANQFSREIIHDLKGLGVKNEIVDGILLVFPWPGANANQAVNESRKRRALEIGRRLTSARSREIYEFITGLRFATGSPSAQSKIQSFYAFMDRTYGTGNQHMASQYFEYGTIDNVGVAIEGGCNVGLIAKKILERANGTRLISFEPMQATIEQQNSSNPAAKYLADATEVGRFTLVPQALWSDTTTLYFDSSTNDPARAQAALEGRPNDRVDATSIDSYCADNALGPVGFIKLDVEGAEPHVLEGAMATIDKDRPVMAISIYHRIEQILTIPEMLIDSLSDYDFEVGHHSNSPWLETVLYCLPR